ncbi:MAG: hypothetical protein IJK42_00130 [Prevotella sp.]|nr:hypothetical protein [Prevotella sp.]MBQ6208170.1 hypothetical protein [Prevotella sp.]
MKRSDKTTLAKSHEIGSREIGRHCGQPKKSGFSRRIYPFNIFWAASVGSGCHIYRPWMWHLSGADAAQNMLKWGIHPWFPYGCLCKTLMTNGLQNHQKTAFFHPKRMSLRKVARICGCFVINN